MSTSDEGLSKVRRDDYVCMPRTCSKCIEVDGDGIQFSGDEGQKAAIPGWIKSRVGPDETRAVCPIPPKVDNEAV